MCGRYVADASIDDLAAEFDAIAAGSVAELMPSYNVAPTDRVPVVLERTDEPPGRTRQLHAARWGLIPSWAKDPGGGATMINARIETVADKPAFRGPVARRRCVLPARGYYEWQRGSGRAKRPYFIHSGGGLLAMAGVFEWWRDPSVPADDPRRWVLSASVLTTTPVPGLAHIHDRMPVLLSADVVPDWLDRRNEDAPALLDLARSAAERVGASLEARPVGPEVGNVRNNHAGLLAEADPVQPDLLGS
ncbi:SOS response-associated peptidase [Jiangella rhizosphaerae]|uniref:Abasic site processing protein n=1 Tax=Jiangella rhizosphaerae TaxID=2293569 RepID=A0A418KNB7_9ACTN|nr:SOS response-associated peptidase [Jiangella rhizosphaerae]RIQ20416.1 SOS response-associated peptidase [Jiangella rhizosphaerae]